MSLIPFEDLFSRRPVFYHRHYTPDLMTSILSDSLGQLQQLERQLGELQGGQMDGEDGKYTFKCSVAGYRPEELSVDVQGDELVIQGKHQQQADGQSIHRTFERRLTLPSTLDKQSIQCHLDEQGRLQVKAAKKGGDKQQTKVNIPIGFKPSDPQQQQQQQLTNDNKKENKSDK